MDEEELRLLMAMRRAPRPSDVAGVPSDQGYIDSGPGPQGAFAPDNIADTADTVGDFAFGMTGIPMAAQAGEDLAAYDSDPWKAARGAGELGISMLPMSGPLSRAAFSTIPRAVGSATIMGAIPNLVTEAEAAQKKKRSEPAPDTVVRKPKIKPTMPDPVVKIQPDAPVATNANGEPDIVSMAAKRDPRIKIMADEKRRLESIIDTETNGKGGYGARAQKAKGDLDEVNKQLTEAIKPYLPFDQAVPPWLARNWQVAQFGVPALVGLMTRGMGRAALNVAPGRFNQAVNQGEKAFHGGMFSKPDLAMADQKMLEIQQRLRSMKGAKGAGMKEFMAGTVMPVAAGAVTGAEMSVAPEQYNRRNTLPGTPEHDLAEKKMSPENIFETMKPGAILGAAGALTSTHMIPYLSKPVADAERGQAFVDLVKGKGGDAAKAKAKYAAAEAKLNTPPPTPPNTPPKPPLTPKDKWWNKAIGKVKSSQSVDEAMQAIDSDPTMARLNGKMRRKIVTDLALQNPNATPQELAKMLRSRVNKLKKTGGFYSSAIGASLGAINVLDNKSED